MKVKYFMDKNRKKLAREWFDSALSDYQYAEIGLKEDQIFPQIAFQSQQVAEKLLKGFLVYNGNEPPRIHDLPKLLDVCIQINPGLEEIRDACELLTGFYIETGYPPDIPDFTKDDIFKAFNMAKMIMDKFSTIIPLDNTIG